MDTRSKIITREEALTKKSTVWVSGHFDPLLAEHVRRLREYKIESQPLIVEITNPLKPLLSQRARAELVAALSIVDYVILSDTSEPSGSIDDAAITERFIEHVRERHRAEVT